MEEEIIEILVEEPSMKNLLEIILPKILPEGYLLNENCFIRPHQGKSDLKKSIPRKVRAYQYLHQPVKLIVIQDQDSNDCLILKRNIVELITENDASLPYLVRVACRELENWYLGDMNAIQQVYPSFKAKKHQNKTKYRIPDNVFGSAEMDKLVKEFSKGRASKTIPHHMRIEGNRSPSFNHLISGIQRFLEQ